MPVVEDLPAVCDRGARLTLVINGLALLRVGHLILRALAIRASNPQNALAQISFHSPKSLPPPPGHSNHFSHLLF